MSDSPIDHFRPYLGALKTAGLALLGVFGISTYTFEARLEPAVLALLFVSAMGWYRLLRGSPERELLERPALNVSHEYAALAVVQIMPPYIFFASALFHSRIHFTLEEWVFIAAGIATTVPVIGLAKRTVDVHRMGKGGSAGQLGEPAAESDP